MGRQAQSSIGVIIIFIAVLLVAAIGAGVFIQNINSYQSSTSKTGDQVQREVSTVFFVMDIVGTDGNDGDIEHLKQIIKLPPGTDPIGLEYLTLILNTPTHTATLDYRGPNGTLQNSNQGFNTWTPEEVDGIGRYYELVDSAVDGLSPTDLEVDLDYDGINDTVVVCEQDRGYCPNSYSGEYIKFDLSTGGEHYVRLLNSTGGQADISVKDGEEFGNLLTPIGDYGYVTLNGNEGTTDPYQIPPNRINVYQQPFILEEDLDDDGKDDSLVVNDTHLIMHYSHNGNISLQLNRTEGVAYPLGADLSTGPTTLDTTINLKEGGKEYGTATLNGTTSRASYIDPDVQFTITPQQLNKGYFSVNYIQTTENTREGFLRQGDVIRLYYEAPAPIEEGEEVKILLTSRSGAVTRTEFYMPTIMNTESINLDP